jgi:hypothetical protein
MYYRDLVGLSRIRFRGRDQGEVNVDFNDDLFKLRTDVQTRWASPENTRGEKGRGGRSNAGRKGSPCIGVVPGAVHTLAKTEGSGTIRRIWMTLSDRSPEVMRSVQLDFAWDGADVPSFSVPFGDFFGHPLGRVTPLHSSLFSNPEGRSFNCFIPMPFKTGMEVTLRNLGEATFMCYYDIDYTIGDTHGDDAGYFFALFGRRRQGDEGVDYDILPRIEGKGRFLGANVGVNVDTDRYLTTWWGEGEARIYLDGDHEHPTLCGTGTEDYIGTAWDLEEPYSTPFQGCPLVDFDRQEFGFYRYHVPDPVYFREDIRVIIQQIGICPLDVREELAATGYPFRKAAPGTPVFDLSDPMELPPYLERTDDMSSCAYFYLDRPDPDLPPVPSIEERTADLAPASEPSKISTYDPKVVAAYFALLDKNREL